LPFQNRFTALAARRFPRVSTPFASNVRRADRCAAVRIHRVRRGDVAMIRDAPSLKMPLRWRRPYLQKRRLERIVLQV
jgi:hypothetical protein